MEGYSCVKIYVNIEEPEMPANLIGTGHCRIKWADSVNVLIIKRKKEKI